MDGVRRGGSLARRAAAARAHSDGLHRDAVAGAGSRARLAYDDANDLHDVVRTPVSRGRFLPGSGRAQGCLPAGSEHSAVTIDPGRRQRSRRNSLPAASAVIVPPARATARASVGSRPVARSAPVGRASSSGATPTFSRLWPSDIRTSATVIDVA